MHEQIIQTTDFTVLRYESTQTFLVKAVDVAGHESVNPATITIDVGDIAMENVMLSTDHRALGWPGTITNATIISGDLAANTSGTFWSVDTANMWPLADSALFWRASGQEMTYAFSVNPSPALLDATIKLNITMRGDGRIDYSQDSTALMWTSDDTVTMWNTDQTTLMWSTRGAFLPAPAVIAPLKAQDYQFLITGSAGIVEAVLQQLVVSLDVPDLDETFVNLAIAPAGTRVPITKRYRAIVVVAKHLNDDGGTAAFIRTMDKDAVLGPLVQAFDVTNTPTAAHADVVVQGY